MRFTELSKIIKNMKDLDPRLHQLKYYIYDFNCVEKIPAHQRLSLLNSALKQYLDDGYTNTRFEILYTKAANCADDIHTTHKQFRASGFEGTIIRKTDSMYKGGRGTHLLKHKDIEDAEGIVVGVTEASGTQVGAALLTIRCTHENEKDQEG